MISLSHRLSAVAAMVSPGDRVVDIGTDHAYIPMYLVEQGVKKHAIAGDVNKGPLTIAAKHIEANSLSDCISTCLSNGLDKLDIESYDSIVIAGMGGLLIKSILANDLSKSKVAKELVLQPQSEIRELRSFLYENGFVIVNEDAVYEDGKYYFIMKALLRERYLEQLDRCTAPNGQPAGQLYELNSDMLEFGPVLLNKKHPVLKAYIEKQLEIMSGVRSGLIKSQPNPGIVARMKEVETTISKLKSVLEEYYAV